ncbi:MAG: PHP domain-containing protein [Clostridia bacterium]|nr:PHP domain-containing protein [Clostridia bacterium]
MNKFVDLHIHTKFSDGENSPDEILKKASQLGAEYISFTDHDSISAYENIISETNLKIIKGCEFTTKFDEISIHILGYGLDLKNPELKQYFTVLRQAKFERLKIYKQVLEKNGLNIPREFYQNIFENNYGISASRIIFYLQENNYNFDVNSIYKAMRQKASKVQKPFKNAVEIIDLIHKSGAMAFLAHPMDYKLNNFDLNNLVTNLKTCGLDGLELYHSEITPEELPILKKIAEKNHLKISGGSDFHSYKLENRKLVNFSSGNPITTNQISPELLMPQNLFAKSFERTRQ